MATGKMQEDKLASKYGQIKQAIEELDTAIKEKGISAQLEAQKIETLVGQLKNLYDVLGQIKSLEKGSAKNSYINQLKSQIDGLATKLEKLQTQLNGSNTQQNTSNTKTDTTNNDGGVGIVQKIAVEAQKAQEAVKALNEEQQKAQKEAANTSAYNKWESIVTNLNSQLTTLSDEELTSSKIPSYLQTLTDAKNKVQDIQNLLNQQNKLDPIDDNTKQELENTKTQIEQIIKDLKGKGYNPTTNQGTAKFSDMEEAINAVKNAGGVITKEWNNGNGEVTKFTASVKQADDTVKSMTYALDSQTGVVREAFTISPVTSFTKSIKNLAVQLASYYLTTSQLIHYMKEGFESVQELDAAFIEMQKVSDESTESLREFSDTSFDVAKSLGTTAVSLQDSTADWMRLGKSLEEATEMAQDTQILMNVSEFDSITDATDALISMTQAYSDLEAMDIINKVNNVGNNFAISTDEASTALQKSASSLVTAGNSIDEALALITTANTVAQDSDSVANALKVVSMRITGTSTKTLAADLQEAGEDTDSLITTVSKLRSTIKSLTAIDDFEGVDILDSNGNYKSTYKILQEIADVWDKLSAADKEDGLNRTNALLETLAGKQRANTIASILQNAELLKTVYEDSLNSEGSAEKENAKYLEGYEAKLNALTTSVQEFWYTFIDSDSAKDFIDFLTNAIDLVKQLAAAFF